MSSITVMIIMLYAGIKFYRGRWIYADARKSDECKSYPLEVHLAHADSNGNLAVMGVMFTESKENKALEKAWGDARNRGRKKFFGHTGDC